MLRFHTASLDSDFLLIYEYNICRGYHAHIIYIYFPMRASYTQKCESKLEGPLWYKHSMLYIEPLGRGTGCLNFEVLSCDNPAIQQPNKENGILLPQFRRNMFQTLKSEGGMNAFQMQCSYLQWIVLFVKITALEYT